jgi:tRNA dimethylallyltransferase
MTVYRGLDIGTAKPSAAVLARVPHAAVDVVDPDGEFSVADFIEAFEQARSLSPHVLVVGGTPFYLSALVRPIADMPAADPEVRAELEGLDDPHARLVEVDPERAAALHPNDRLRIVRALEVHLLSGKTMTELHAAGTCSPPVSATTVWMDTDELDERIERRLRDMLAAGYVAEVDGLLAAGWDPSLKPLRAFGYRHLVEHVRDGLDLDEALRRTGRDTRRFARKQRTWSRGLNWQPAGALEIREAARVEFGRE